MTTQRATAHITFTYDPAEGKDVDIMAQEIADNIDVWTDIFIETINVEEEG